MSQMTQTFSVQKLQFVNLTLPDPVTRKYALAFPAVDLPGDLVPLVHGQHDVAMKSPRGLMSVRTQIKPPVFGQEADSSDLAEIRQFCWNTGCPFDRLLRDLPAELEVVLYERTHRSDSFPDKFGWSLRSIRIDPGHVTLPKWGT